LSREGLGENFTPRRAHFGSAGHIASIDRHFHDIIGSSAGGFDERENAPKCLARLLQPHGAFLRPGMLAGNVNRVALNDTVGKQARRWLGY
jgi:hypothetical protein